ncbi:potassium uptake protein, TrkH family [Salinimicrobium sediminis]|uniref:Potassium uptake protein, TrkH family n=1 Tax=Salinimicrobium sediminis TaxID=1343891 RepID=A0A285X080_9FLAO|nr:potassium transporter TrkG [Salinimicrobium sediminis]SOC78735.1 potassium uptake protein, TrkH family [Salinimicrobium sediminis]
MNFPKHQKWEKIEQRLASLQKFSFWLSLFAVCLIIFDIGFTHRSETELYLTDFYLIALLIGSTTILVRYTISKEKFPVKVRFFDGTIFILNLLLVLIKLDLLLETFPFLSFFNNMGWLYLALLIYFIREFSARRINFNRELLNPAQLFIASFLGMILVGTLLLMLPRATHEGISALNALFTATSAVCVTGLIVVDTGTYFTNLGQTIILILIQMGGLGIMTFASYFSYFFRGKSSYEHQIMLKDMTNSEKIGEVFSVLKKIVLLTFAIELVGALFIFISLEPGIVRGFFNQVFFSIFHSISGFCNAGFSTLENSLYEPEFRFNYPLQLIIVSLFILGGIGFPILFNVYKYFTYYFRNQYAKWKHPANSVYTPWVISLNTRIVLATTSILLVVGTVLFYFFEYDNTLAEHTGFGKLVVSLFGAATPRTAGFNSVDTSALNFPTIMIVFILMWIGASPGSTGGGIKTSTFALTTLNFLSLGRGKNRVEVFRREISDLSIRRAFAIISLSLMVIGTSIFLIASFDEEKTLLSIAFECFSAYSTVGLSIGITPELSSASKVVIIATMFIGRVSMLTILIALLRRVKYLSYRYPQEEILMN